MDGTHRALLKAADRIEQHPDQYNFGLTTPPVFARDAGCALGWLAYYLYPRAERYGLRLDEVAERLDCEPDDSTLGISSIMMMSLTCGEEDCPVCIPTITVVLNRHESTFYRRMDKLNRAKNWRHKPERCAQTLRKYADKYHKVAA
jgi:hypothetical protein